MKQLAKIVAISALLGVTLWSCTGKDVLEELHSGGSTNQPKAQGTLKVEITPTGKFEPIDLAPAAKSADEIEEGVNINLFTLQVKDLSGKVIKSWGKYGEFEGQVALEEGAYTVEAASPVTKDAAFNQPIYKGSSEVSVEATKMMPLNILCTLTNMKVSVICSEAFQREISPDYTIIVSNGKGILAYNDGETRAGFFTVAPLIVQLNGTRASDGAEVIQTLNINDVAAKDHHIITLNAVETGVTVPGISIDYTTNNKDHNVTIPGEDEEGTVPEEDEGDGGDDGGGGGGVTPPVTQKPTITGNGIGFPLTLTDAQASQDPAVDIKITTNNSGISELWVTINSPELTPEVLGVLGIPSSFDLANLTPGSELEGVMRDLGLIGTDPVKGQSAFKVAIGTFMKFLTAGETGTLDHLFEVTVKDGDGNSLTKTLTVRRTL